MKNAIYDNSWKEEIGQSEPKREELTASDYALMVLRKSGNPLTASVITDKMKELGWSSTSSRPYNITHAILTRGTDVFFQENGLWYLKEWKRMEPSLDLIAADAEAGDDSASDPRE